MWEDFAAKARSWLSGFTTRACCLLAAGFTAAICGLLLGETDLVRAGAFAVAIPLVANVIVRRSQVNIASRRSAEPARASAGTPTTVSLTVTNRSVLPTGTLMMEDTLPARLPGRARFVLDGLGRRESRAVSYRIPSLPRGRYTVGPLRLRLTDPFRLVDVHRSFTATSQFVLTPVVEPLPGLPLPRSWDTGENLGSHSVGARGADDASTREYRRGDDLRKIHWRSTARIGALMVRHEERPWQAHTVVLLDARVRGHERMLKEPVGADPRETNSLEWAISATASIATHLLANQREVTLAVGATSARHVGAEAGALLDTLAGLEGLNDRDLTGLLRTTGDAGREATLIAVIGRLDPESLRALTELHPRGAASPAFAILLETPSWRDPIAKDPSWANSAATLRASGWSVIGARNTDKVATIWTGLVSQRGDNRLASSGYAVPSGAGPDATGPSTSRLVPESSA